MDFISFKLFSGNHFSENQIQIHPQDQLGAPGAVHPQPLTSGPACQPGPLAERREGATPASRSSPLVASLGEPRVSTRSTGQGELSEPTCAA